MPKRKSDNGPSSGVSLTSLDAALDLLACDTFTRLDALSSKFESAAGLKLNDGVVKSRWEEAVRRYWVMKSMDDLCCSMTKTKQDAPGEVEMDDQERPGRPLPAHAHPGAISVFGLDPEEELEWRRWSPKIGDAVLVELSDDSVWPGKIIEKKTFFQGRTQPRGNHFFCVRIYAEDMSPTVTIKSRLIPLHLRPSPPLLASTPILSAYNHANNPASFDMKASARESLAAHQRTHPGVGAQPDLSKIKAEKASWNELVNWVMSERRVEKLRAVEEERARRLKEVTKNDHLEGVGEMGQMACPKKRKTSATVPLPPTDSPNGSVKSVSPAPTIFGPAANVTPRRIGSPSLAGIIRPSLVTPKRPNSPRRYSRRSIHAGVGEYSPRGGTYTPPRILPSGDETAPFAAQNGSPAPSLQSFDFVSPLGPVKLGRLESHSTVNCLQRKGSLEVVKEESTEGEWTLVESRRSKRAGSAPCRDKSEVASGGMSVDA